MCGVGGTRTIVIETIGSGIAHFYMVYTRPWEFSGFTNWSPEDEFETHHDIVFNIALTNKQ